MRVAREGRLAAGKGYQEPKEALTLNGELIELRKQLKLQEKEIKNVENTKSIKSHSPHFYTNQKQIIYKS
ncbi:MAG: hypothetical protein IJ583_07105 [Firmicutes bacterium]|nr:hypothetical protein [Bacillota bacterium]